MKNMIFSIINKNIKKNGFWRTIYKFFSNPSKYIQIVLFRIKTNNKRKPVLLSQKQLLKIIKIKKKRRDKIKIIKKKREKLVSIAIFACDRLDLLKKTYNSFWKYLDKYGKSFKYELILFHDGTNKSILNWAKKQKFDDIYFSKENKGLDYQINKFMFEVSKGNYLLTLEDDWVCKYKDNFIKKGLDILESNEDVGCIRFEKKYKEDYKSWETTKEISSRIMSKKIYSTPENHRYRMINNNPSGTGIFGNGSSLLRFEAVEIIGERPLSEDIPRRKKEGIYSAKFNQFWMGARGIEQKDSPFLHIGQGLACESWKK